ncbi:MAG TPA: PBP1A family penicillin-binding protein [Armatimonadota bacterium]|jgi:penicillin-binding protein 1A
MRRPGIPRFFLYANALLLVGVFSAMGFVTGSIGRLHTLMPEQLRLRGYQPPLITEIYSTERNPGGRDTHTLLARVFKENREYTPLSDMPQRLTQAVVDVEDRRFFEHIGISPRDIMRAALIDVTGHHMAQGASTITQQLVRNVWLSQARTWDRKLKEVLLALELERNFSKTEILEMYLNEVYFGRGAYGVKTAAMTYFRKQPQDLDLAQCALLAGLAQRPAGYDPFTHGDIAKARRREVLQAMVTAGDLSVHDSKLAMEEPVVARDAGELATGVTVLRAPYFSHLVIQQLVQMYDVDTVYRGGLRVYTSLDMRLQESGQKIMDEWVAQKRADGAIRSGLNGQGALACVDVHDGRVLTMIGGIGPYEKLQYNRAYPGPPGWGRQPGSSMKPYVWCAALEAGYSPSSQFSGDPISLPSGTGKPWTPKNYSARQGGSYSLREALAQSVNLVSVRVLKTVGVDRVRELAGKIMDISPDRLSPYLALALGVSNLSPLEQASGYATFASGGIRNPRTFILQVDDYWGRTVYAARPDPKQVIEQPVAVSMISMLGSVVRSGTGQRAQSVGYPCGGKTGTTQDGRDAWWVGFTPDLSAAVWVGNDDYSPMNDASGGGFCAPVWARFVHDAMQTLGYDGKFPEGSGVVATRRAPRETKSNAQAQTVTLCSETNQRATSHCPSTYEKTFSSADQIPRTCTVHGGSTPRSASPGASAGASAGGSAGGRTVTVSICTASGRLAGPYCPSTEEKTFPAGKAPRGRCTVHGPGH